jgi:hypothetical protein
MVMPDNFHGVKANERDDNERAKGLLQNYVAESRKLLN